MKVAVVTFPGSNCDHDCLHAVRLLGHEPVNVWHTDMSLPNVDSVVLPGGFSYGDYLRCGAIARFSPIMQAVKAFADQGGKVLGICNGFQILTEAGLLPGALLKNKTLKFICKPVDLRLENAATALTWKGRKGQVLRMPIAHGEGNYFASEETLAKLEANGQIILRYAHANGEVDDASNPNGACHHIAGLMNERGNVFGMMPHPERAVEKFLGSEDGRVLLSAFFERQAP